jgi:hypothetical protein
VLLSDFFVVLSVCTIVVKGRRIKDSKDTIPIKIKEITAITAAKIKNRPFIKKPNPPNAAPKSNMAGMARATTRTKTIKPMKNSAISVQYNLTAGIVNQNFARRLPFTRKKNRREREPDSIDSVYTYGNL